MFIRYFILAFALLFVNFSEVLAEWPTDPCKGTFTLSRTKYTLNLAFKRKVIGYKVSGKITGKSSGRRISYKVSGVYGELMGLIGTATELLPKNSSKKPKVLNLLGKFLSNPLIWAIEISRSKKDKNPIDMNCPDKSNPGVVTTVAPPATPTTLPVTPFKISTYRYNGNIPNSLSYAVGTYGELLISYESNPPAIFPIRATVIQSSTRPTTLFFTNKDVVFNSPSAGNAYEGVLAVSNGIGCDGILNQTTQGKIITKATITDAVGKTSSWTVAWFCCPDFAMCPAS